MTDTMDDDGSFSSEMILKTEVKEEPLDEDESEEDDELSVEFSGIPSQSSGIKEEMPHTITSVENIPFGAMKNEEVLPDSYSVVPDAYPVAIKDEVTVEEFNNEEIQICEHLGRGQPHNADSHPATGREWFVECFCGTPKHYRRVLKAALNYGNSVGTPEVPGHIASSASVVVEKNGERNVSISTSGPSTVDGLMPHKKQKILPTLAQAAVISNLQAEGKPQTTHVGGNTTKVDVPASTSLPYTVPSSVLATTSNSEPSSSAPLSSSVTVSSITPMRSVSSLPFSHVNFPTPGPSRASLDIALPLAPASCTDLMSTAAAEEGQETVSTARKRLKRSCPVEALNVVQEMLLNPSPYHVYHLHSLAAFMTARLRAMGSRKRKRVENRLIQLILEEDL